MSDDLVAFLRILPWLGFLAIPLWVDWRVRRQFREGAETSRIPEQWEPIRLAFGVSGVLLILRSVWVLLAGDWFGALLGALIGLALLVMALVTRWWWPDRPGY